MKKILCWLLALLLTGMLALFGVSHFGAELIAPGLREGGAAASGSVQEAEMELIRQKAAELADIYGFSAETAMRFVTPEKLAQMNDAAAQWWNSLLANGEEGEAPAFDTDEMAAAFVKEMQAEGSAENGEEPEVLAAEAANAVGRSILRIVLPLRLPVISKGLTEAAARVDIANVIRFLTGIRWAALALCALLAGLIAMLESRRLRNSLKYIGSAMGAAVLVLAGGGALYVLSGIDPLIGEASRSLSVQYGSLLTGAAPGLFIYAGLLLIGCVACLILCRRTHEADTD